MKKAVIHITENGEVVPLTFANWATVRVVKSAAGLMEIHLAALPFCQFCPSAGGGVC